MESLFGNLKLVQIHQIKEFFEIAINWETANKYEILDEQGAKIGYAAERKTGILQSLLRNILRSHRPLTLDVWNQDKKLILSAKRPFYFLFSDMKIFEGEAHGRLIGEIKTRFGILKRKYDLLDGNGKVFARIESFRWKLWTFTVHDGISGKETGRISKKWGGILKEAFTDSDRFSIDLSQKNWSHSEKAVLLLAALCVDLDFFEDNSSSATGLFD